MPEDTPLMRQWREVKSRHRDALVFFRVGDFFELFNDDAEEGARLLGLTLTSRNNGAAARVPLAGVPAKALDDYLGRLVALGRRVAICDQVEDPAEAKGIVKREVVETVTPGTVVHESLLEARRNNFVLAVAPEGEELGLAALDLSTGEFTVRAADPARARDEIARLEPSEVLAPRALGERLDELVAPPPAGPTRTFRDDWWFEADAAADLVQRRFELLTLDGLGFQEGDGALVSAAGALLAYVDEIRPAGADHVRPPRIERPGSVMTLDDMTRRNLELVEPLRSGEDGGTVLHVLDSTVTAMGARALRAWLLAPLVEAEAVWERQETVRAFEARPDVRRSLRDELSGVADLERLAGRLSSRAGPRDLVALRTSLERIPPLRELAGEVDGRALAERLGELDPMSDVAQRLANAIADEVPATLGDGGVIRPGFSAELDEARELRDGAREYIASLQARERERTGIGSLKVGYNKVFGYYLEVTKANTDKVPDDYHRKQTLANAERYFTPELKEWEEKVVGAEERIGALEAELFARVRAELVDEIPRLQTLAGRLARLDVLASFAETAARRAYVRPEVHTGFELRIEAGRHPVVETMMPEGDFIPNDVVLDEDERIVILTGPNMAGKSTVLRQVGLIQLLAQIGSWVPADRALIPIADRIFTRVGASDNLARGQSTFMVEMNETAAILNGASERSLVLLDEIGRGTSTYDGVSIAWAVTEHIHERTRAKTIFATHYHELTQLGDLLPGVKNLNVSVREAGDRIVFLRRLEEGGADRSYGIQVARLAGLPPDLIDRARELLAELEGTHTGGGEGLGREGRHAPTAPSDQLSFFRSDHPILERLRGLDPDRMTPLEALGLLHSLRRELGDDPS